MKESKPNSLQPKETDIPTEVKEVINASKEFTTIDEIINPNAQAIFFGVESIEPAILSFSYGKNNRTKKYCY